MNEDIYKRSRGLGGLPEELPKYARRFAPVVLFFAIAFVVDLFTNQRYSSVWGSAAIIASVITVFPSVRPALAALGAYAAVWLVFNLGRAVADDAGLALAGTGAVSSVESALFGGSLPSAWLQARFFDPAHVQVHDVVLSLVHGSFFIVPFVVACMLWWKRREWFGPYTVATAVAFTLGVIGFLLLPTAPPWMRAPADVARVTHHVVAETAGISLGDGGGEGFWFEPNHLAALPSVHVAAAVLVFLLSMRAGRSFAILGGLYVVLMSVAVVYLGEHFVLDVVLGWGVALFGWRVARLRYGKARFGLQRSRASDG